MAGSDTTESAGERESNINALSAVCFQEKSKSHEELQEGRVQPKPTFYLNI